MMQLFQKLSTAMRGGTREVLESAVDSNALRILSQEIYECEANLREAKEHLANVVAEKLKLKRILDGQKDSIESKEAAIREQLSQNNESIAMQLAEELADQEALQERQQANYDQLQSYEQNLLQVLKNTAYTLGQYRTELNMARATQNAQKTMGKVSVHKNVHGDSFSRMQDSLDRIRKRQDDFGDQMQAMQEVDAYMKGEASPQQQNRKKAEDILSRFKS